MRVFAVVVNWNGAATIRACLSSLAEQTLVPERVVLVDNASRDGSLADALTGFPSVVVIRNDVNRGYGYANNQGIEHALAQGAEAVLLVNNDAELAPDALAILARALEQEPRKGIVGPRILLAADHGRLWSAGGLLTYRENLTTLIGHGRHDGQEWQRETEVDYVPGCVMLVRREVFAAVGGLEADYFAYMEDVDFCVRARRRGFTSGCAGLAAAYHHGSASTGGGYTRPRKYMMGVNSVWFLRRFGRPVHWARFVLFDVLTLPAVLALELPRGRGMAVLAKAKGILDGLRGRHVHPGVVEAEGGTMWRWGSIAAARATPLAPRRAHLRDG